MMEDSVLITENCYPSAIRMGGDPTMASVRHVDSAAWPHVLRDLQRLGATPGEVCRVAEMLECGQHELALCLVEAALERLRGV